MFAYFSQGLVLGGTAAANPGPFQAYLLSQTLKNGWRRTLLATFAPLISDGPIIVLVLAILTQTPGWFLNLLRILGGLFLLYLAWGAYRSFRAQRETAVATPPVEESVQEGLFKAVFVNALNPGVYIYWAAITGPIFIEGWRHAPGLGLSFMLGFYGTLIGGLMGFVLLFATAKRIDPRLNRVLSGISALGLFLFGLYQLWLGLMAL